MSLNVSGGNHFAKLLFGNTTTALNVNTTNATHVTAANGGASSLTSIKKGDRALALYKVCKSSVTGSSANVASASALATYLSSLSPRKVVDRGQGDGQD